MITITNEDKRSDVLARKAAWQKDYDIKKAEYNAQEQAFENARDAVKEATIDEVKSQLGNIPKYLTIDVTPYRRRFEIKLDYADWSNVHKEDKALSWHFTVVLDEDGNVNKETGSWSGLQATTREQLDDLKETLRLLEVLNTMDWETIIKKAQSSLPKYKDYVTVTDPANDRPDWDREIINATLEDAVGKNILIKGTSDDSGRDTWYGIVKQTPKRFEVFTVLPYYVRQVQDGDTSNFDSIADIVNNSNRYTHGISKDKFYNLIYNWRDPENVETIEY